MRLSRTETESAAHTGRKRELQNEEGETRGATERVLLRHVSSVGTDVSLLGDTLGSVRL